MVFQFEFNQHLFSKLRPFFVFSISVVKLINQSFDLRNLSFRIYAPTQSLGSKLTYFLLLLVLYAYFSFFFSMCFLLPNFLIHFLNKIWKKNKNSKKHKKYVLDQLEN